MNRSRSLELALRVLVILGVNMSAALSAADASAPELAGMLPKRVHGFEGQEPDGVYTADTLFSLIDGSAEVYRAFNVRRVVSRRYAKAAHPDIIADVFDMGSSADAFGAYHHDVREDKSAGIGQESESMGSSLYFWKDRYFVSIVALGDSAPVRRAVLALGKALDGAIAGSGSGPTLRRLLPSTGLLDSHTAYFHGWEYLNTRYAIAEDNLLLLNRKTEGILARYRTHAGTGTKADVTSQSKAGAEAEPETQAGSLVLLLVRYPSTGSAGKAFRRFSNGHLQNADARGVARRDDGTWAGARLLNNVVVAVLDAPGKREIEEMLRRVSQRKTRGFEMTRPGKLTKQDKTAKHDKATKPGKATRPGKSKR